LIGLDLSRLGLAAYWTLIMGAQSRFGTAVFDEIGSVGSRTALFGSRRATLLGQYRWASANRITFGRAGASPALWTQSANARRHFAAETLGEMALASTNFGLKELVVHRPQPLPAGARAFVDCALSSLALSPCRPWLSPSRPRWHETPFALWPAGLPSCTRRPALWRFGPAAQPGRSL